MTQHRFILASRSPRRHELLASLAIPFTVDASDVDEAPQPGEGAQALVIRLSRAKALALASLHAVVLAADTIVALDGVLLGKPADAAEAHAMLEALRGRTHQVVTGVTLALDGRTETRVSVSDVTFRAYTEPEMSAYVATGDPLDTAGAYAIQHPTFAPVAQWRGCYAGIMGLPLAEVAALLREAGWPVNAALMTVCPASVQCCAAQSNRF
jgi:septum formation protein